MSCDRVYGDGLYGECYYGGGETSIPGWVDFPGVNGNMLSVADEPAFDVTKLTIIMKVRHTSWSPSGNDYFASRGDLVWRLILINVSGSVYFGTYDAGSVETAHNVTPPGGIASWADPDGWVWVAASKDPNNGAGQRVSRLYVSTDGETWNNYSTSTIAGVTNIKTSTNPIELGSIVHGHTWDGDIAYMSVRDGVGPAGALGGIEVFRYDARTDLIGVAPNAPSFQAFTGQTVTAFHSGGTPLLIVPTIGGDCEPCLMPAPCPQQVPAASSPNDRRSTMVPCPPGGDC